MNNSKTTDGKVSQITDSLVWYYYKGDEIAWNGEFYLSLLTTGSFRSLKEMDDFWDEYFEAMAK